MISLSQSAFIKLVQGSAVFDLTVSAIRSQLENFQKQAAIEGKGRNWNYVEAAFPYTLEEAPHNDWLYLRGKNSNYRYIKMGISESISADGKSVPAIETIISTHATYGDRGKAIEFCKFISANLQAELTLFNGRTIFYSPRN